MAMQSMERGLLKRVPREFINNGAEGDEATIDRMLMYNYLVENDLLREDETRQIEEVLTSVAERELVGLADLRGAGLTVDLRDIGVTNYQFENVGPVDPAHQSMSIRDLGDRDLAAFGLNEVPVPVTSSQFELDARAIAAGRTRGQGVDMTNVERHTRSVSEKLEQTLTNGGDVVLGSNTLPGYTNFAARQTVTLTTAWDELSNLTNAVQDVLDMRAVLRNDGYNGPYILYLPANWDGVLDDDYKAESNRTLRERLIAIDGVSQLKVLPSLADDNALLVQMTSDVVVSAIGQDISTVTWDIMGGLASRWAIIAVLTFALKTAKDSSGNDTSGIAHLS